MVSLHSQKPAILSRVNEADFETHFPRFGSQHSTPHSTPLTTRTSSLKFHRPMPAHSSSICSFADDNKSQYTAALQTFLLCADDRSSSERSNHWSSSDISSTRSFSAVSVPVTSHDKMRPYRDSTTIGTSFSSLSPGGITPVGELRINKFSGTVLKKEADENIPCRNGSSVASNQVPTFDMAASLNAVEEHHKLCLQL